MGALQVDIDQLSAAGQRIKDAALQLDSLRVDLWVRALGVGEAAGDLATGASAHTFATAADQYLSAVRDELAGLYEYTLALTLAAEAADGAGNH
ncbi:MAG TPA: hypothetical protein VFW71_06000 [Actinomycetota bacterium]|nr:hypothetical protein [Actinomycetota bacterium]